MVRTPKLLYLEDTPEDVELLTETLAREYLPCAVTWVNSRTAFERALSESWNFDLILADYRTPDLGGGEALSLAMAACPDVPFIFLSGHMGEEKVVECLRQGATDYVFKTNLPRLAPVIRRALQEVGQATARREAEAANARMVALLRATLEATSEGIVVVDLAGRIANFNRKFMALCGIPDYVMAPMSMEGVLTYLMEQAADPVGFLAEALGGNRDVESHGMLRFKNDRVLEGRGGPHQVAGQTVGRVFSFRDVTDREASAERLRVRAGTMELLLGAAGAVGVVPWALANDRLVLGPSARALLGREGLPADLAQLEALVHPGDRDTFRRAFERPPKDDFQLRLSRGSGSWTRTRWRLRRAEGESYHGVFQEEA